MKTKFYILILVVILSSCKKDWLEEKRDISIIVPTTLKDIDLLLSREGMLHWDGRGIGEVSADDANINTTQYNALPVTFEQNALIWKREGFWDNWPAVKEWDGAYNQVFYSNIVLETLQQIQRNETNAKEYDTYKGTALYMRARAFLNLAMTFCKYYDASTASNDLGVPLKLTSNINEKITRTSLQATYDRIVVDLTEATGLLPNTVLSKYRPTKAAAYGLLARCYLFMDRYNEALQAANSSYALQSFLLDFNTLNPTASQPVPTTSDEIHTIGNMVDGYYTFIQSGNSSIDNALYASYESNDLRKSVLFMVRPDGAVYFKARWSPSGLFASTAVNEMLLIRAECKARQNDASGAMADLNTMLMKRYKSGTLVPRSASNGAIALDIVLTERRKELIRRGLRWHDLKRFNRDPTRAITLTRTIDGVVYTLPPNDPRYVIPIPDYVIKLNGIAQNPR